MKTKEAIQRSKNTFNKQLEAALAGTLFSVLRVNLPELALAGFLAAFAARGGDSGAGREADLPGFFKQIQTFRVTPWGISCSIFVKDTILLKLKPYENTGLS